MTTKILLGICCLVTAYSLSSCTKDGEPGPPGPPGDTGVYIPLKGDISGKVTLNEQGDFLPELTLRKKTAVILLLLRDNLSRILKNIQE